MSNKLLKRYFILLFISIFLSLIKIYTSPYGGSITLFGLLFIVLIAYTFGFRLGFVGAITVGIVQFIVHPNYFTPMQSFMEYVISYGVLSIGVLFVARPKSFYLEKIYIIGCLSRFFVLTFTTYIFYNNNVPVGVNPLMYSFICSSYILPEMVVTLILIELPFVKDFLRSVTGSSDYIYIK